MESLRMESMNTLNSYLLECIAYSINGAGGGGNVRELHNPQKIGGIVALTEEMREMGKETVPLYSVETMKEDASVCCVARLGSPGAKADHYATEAANAIIEGLEALSTTTGLPFPKAIVPVEATAGQMARATRAALAAWSATGSPIGILDGDICGGMAVPAIPLAFNIKCSLAAHPDIALIQLVSDGQLVKPQVVMIEETDPEKLEDKLRQMAASSEMGAVWFAWLMTTIKESDPFTRGSVSSSIRRGRIVKQAIEKGKDPSNALLEEGEINEIVATGTVIEVVDESNQAPGFAQYSYVIDTPLGRVILAARNEYIVVYTPNGQILCRAPEIISVLSKKGPIQSHILKVGDEISIITSTPQALAGKPKELRDSWVEVWKKYWEREQTKRTWRHPY